MSGHRQAAAVLHGLAAEDRDLILAELPATDQAALQAYLQELRELGFEGGPDAVAPVAPAAGNPRDVLARAGLVPVQALLAAEPASLVGQLLALGPWSWADELLAQMPAARREAVQAAAAQRPAPALARFLLEDAARRLADSVPAAPAPGRRGLLKPLLRLVRPWTR
ncbi:MULTISPECIES: hypothetical protein [unclassified Duganella]|uniref:hypothetical protein n=1 Tax=unclassified Duganella TaxID=2636909 RepID=UPI0006FC6EB5|nr:MULTISPECIES: hypothetical protein [unclassified Duganella]KQV57992.1 hypothetical protein ASD07_26460 [Duganella sp. Root336D2]KRB99157.1 hypothetical protein ASE26_24690 [Duganella sp. Root198D2]